MKRLTVLHLDTHREWRAGERQVVLLSRAMAAAGHRPIVVGRPGGPVVRRAREEGLTALELPTRGRADLVAALALRRLLQRHKVQLVHAHTPLASALAVLATLGRSTPVVTSRRTDERLRDDLPGRLERARVDAYIAVSAAVARVLAAGGVPPGRIAVVPDGIDLDRAPEALTPAERRALGLPATGRLVVQACRLVRHKDPDTFVRSLARVVGEHPDVHGVLVGEGALASHLRALAAELGIAQRMHILTDTSTVERIIASAAVVTLSSTHEGLGGVLLDALAAGRPVVATAAGGVPELIADGDTGVIVPIGDHEAFGAAVSGLLAHAGRAGAMGGAAVCRAAEFSMQALAARTVEVYRTALTG